jgi:hypothetical protein
MLSLRQTVRNALTGIVNLFGYILKLIGNLFGSLGDSIRVAKEKEFFLETNEANSIKTLTTEVVETVEKVVKSEVFPSPKRRPVDENMDYFLKMAKQVKK